MKSWIVLIAFAIGCQPTTAPVRAPRPERYTKLNEPPRPLKPRAEGTVTVYNTKIPDDKYVEVALLADTASNENDAVAKLMRSAATVGCDGIVINGPRRESLKEVSASATCIMFVTDPGTWREPPPLAADECEAKRAEIQQADAQDKYRLIKALPIECHVNPTAAR